MKQTERAQLERMLKAELQGTVDRQKRIEGQGMHPLVLSSRFEHRDEFGTGANAPWLIVDMGKGYLPRNSDYNRGVRYIGADFEDAMSAISMAAHELLRDVVKINGVEILFEGRDIYHYYPEEAPPERLRSYQPDTNRFTTNGTVVVAAGHGVYLHYDSACGTPWCPQRDQHNGIVEDFITPAYADELSHWLIERSHETLGAIARPRSQSPELHTASGHPWWQMGARYALEAAFPTEAEIWASLPSSPEANREALEDIRSRPKFANHIKAATLLHLHTNASENTTITGTRVYYQTGRPADSSLGNSILCYMKELIQAQGPYEDYYVATAAEPNNKGKNRLAEMPSVIVESGFHTNPSDAAALKDPAFRTAAMKGVEKGYRLHAEGEPCKEFRVTDIPMIGAGSNPPGKYVPLLAHYEGYPQLPATIEIETLHCPAGVECEDGTYPTMGTESPLLFPFRCGGDPPEQQIIEFRARLTDADGVRTEWHEGSFTCMGMVFPDVS
ncbi:N-acetylmuramoyl-L-alanine amidase [Lysobacter sp. SG-8]|uniref:N-acetylmuramoyl-L-alanine amidase n=1 Tax=Marilutibacter penaei TaxID=2759900 RepID=A0A7W3YDW8_9GAMM|nr:N-acetylmuramoyl-L-alanine amidase [Lysobacter penaei]MBB1087813.1 N-acetylmuramoyl-L-alanine amidase [Lysobacter penaei]